VRWKRGFLVAAAGSDAFSSRSERPKAILKICQVVGTSTDIEELTQTDSLRAAEKMIDEVRGVRSPAQTDCRYDSGACLVQFGAWFERIPQQATA
jgi:hypothetical protein